MKIYDFTNAKDSDMEYGGNAGLKKGIMIDDEKWFLKFPKNTVGFDKVDISYTTSPLSEYLGSQIFNAIGIETHDTKLGIHGKKVVVACKDFLQDNERLIDYTMIKNAFVEGLEEKLTSSSGSHSDLAGIKIVMDNNPTFIAMPELKDRFWDMFVVDAFIGNNDRNNGNWGIIKNSASGERRIAPVYDNGNSFNNKASDEQLMSLLNDKSRFKQSVYESRICVFTENDKLINPLKYIAQGEDQECNAAVLRVVPKIDMDKIRDIINEIPEEFNGIRVMSNVQKEFYFKSLEYRYENILEPFYNQELCFGHKQNCIKPTITKDIKFER